MLWFILLTDWSVQFPRPLYQEIAVPPYIKNLGDTYQGLYNT